MHRYKFDKRPNSSALTFKAEDLLWLALIEIIGFLRSLSELVLFLCTESIENDSFTCSDVLTFKFDTDLLKKGSSLL